MAIFKSLKKKSAKAEENKDFDRGFLVFENTSEVIQAETLLKKKGWEIRVMGPSPEIRKGCDLVIEFPLIEELPTPGTQISQRQILFSKNMTSRQVYGFVVIPF